MIEAAKDCRGNWRASNDVPIGDGVHVLRITTHKVYSGETITDVMCGRLIYSGSFTYTPSQDYKAVLCRAKVRCTEKYVRAQHQAALDTITAHIQAAQEHYK